MVSLGVQQTVTSPVVPLLQSHNIVVDTEGDNLLVEVAESGRIVLPLREAQPLVEEVPLDYGTTASKALIKDEFVFLEETGQPDTSYRKSGPNLPFWALSGTGVLLLVLTVTSVVVVVVGLVALTRVWRHSHRNSHSRVYVE